MPTSATSHRREWLNKGRVRMKYDSTQGIIGADFPTILLNGAPEKGLYIPRRWPRFGERKLRKLIRAKHYADVAFEVISPYVDRVTRRHLRRLIAKAYTRAKFGSKIVPVRSLGPEAYLLRVSQGPTWAFKDMAMQLLAEVLDFWLEQLDRYLNIVVATSGDTGAAAIEAFRGRKRITVTVMSPGVGKMSDVQKQMMYGVHDAGVTNIVLDGGNFDHAQAILKALMSDALFREKHHLGLVNSINWFRIIAQTAYVAWGWSRIAKKVTDAVAYAVPSGNFGDAYSVFVAQRMGIPIERIIVATNANDVLDRVFKTGRYDARIDEPMVPTESPSMDIKLASNFERILAEAFERDTGAVAHLMSRMQKGGPGWFDISGVPEFEYFAGQGIVSGSCTDAQARDEMGTIYVAHDLAVDPHTAIASRVSRQYRIKGLPLLVIETAAWQKFPETVKAAIGTMPPLPKSYAELMDRKSSFVRLAPNVDAVRSFLDEKFSSGKAA